MVAFSDAAAASALDTLIASYPYLALFSGTGIDAGSGFTEAAFTSYARVNTTGLWTPAGGSTPATKANNATISFPASGSSGGPNLISWGLYSAASGGTLGFWDFLGNFDWKPTTFSLASPAVLSQPAHGYTNGDSVVVSQEMGTEGTIPFPGTPMTVAGVTTDTFTVGVNSTTTGGIMLRKIIQQQIISGLVIRFVSGQLVVKL